MTMYADAEKPRESENIAAGCPDNFGDSGKVSKARPMKSTSVLRYQKHIRSMLPSTCMQLQQSSMQP